MTENIEASTPQDAPRKRSRKKLVAGVAGLAVVAGGAYGAYAAYDRLSGGGTQPHDVLPASTQIYVRADLDPSASQKVKLFKLLRKSPDLAESVGIKRDDQDLREILTDSLPGKCDIDFKRDIKPWVGDRVGLASSVDGEDLAIAVQVTDEKLAREGVKKLFACDNSNYGIGFLDGYAIIAQTQADADASIKEAQAKPLSEHPDFVDDFEQLGDQGVGSTWIDLEAVMKSPSVAQFLGETGDVDYGTSVAATLRVDGNALELAALAGKGESVEAGEVTQIGKLPTDTLFALAVGGSATTVNQIVSELDALGLMGDVQGTSEEFGLDLANDIETLFGKGMTLALGGTNIEKLDSLAGPEDLSLINLALATRGDKDKTLDLAERLAGYAEMLGAQLIAESTDDGAVLATNPQTAAAVANPDGDLSSLDAYKQAIPDDKLTNFGVFLNIEMLVEKLKGTDLGTMFEQEMKALQDITSLGISQANTANDHTMMRVRLGFK
jgi:hypothetical protein